MTECIFWGAKVPELAAVECRTRISCGQIYIYIYTIIYIFIYIYVMYKNDAEQIDRSSNLAQVAELYPIHKVFHPPKKKQALQREPCCI